MIRTATLQDVEKILLLENRSWLPHLAASAQIVKDRIERYPEGQFVLTVKEEVTGVLFTQRVESLDSLTVCQYSSLSDLFHPEGEHLQLISIAVNVDTSPNGAHLLREHVKEFATNDPTIRSIVAVTRCHRFKEHEMKQTYEEYVYSLKDPTIFFHTSGGAKLRKLITNYRPEDIDNQGCGILIEYSLSTMARKLLTKEKLIDYIHSLKKSLKNELSVTDNARLTSKPLLTIFDSLEMMVFHHWLEIQVKETLPVEFLFRFSTIDQIYEGYLCNERKEAVALPLTEENHLDTVLNDDKAVAIVGIGMKLPGEINHLDDLWKVLSTGECLTNNSLTSERFTDFKTTLSSLPNEQQYLQMIQYGGYLSSVNAFDYEFFGINRSEAKSLDPNQRLLLECTARAVYDSGRRLNEIAGSDTGVWIGLTNSDYQLLEEEIGFRDVENVYGATGGANSMTAGRISFLLGLHGPSLMIDAACASSLVALHQACRAIQSKECSEAIVAASNLILTPWLTTAYTKAGMLSPDGKCNTFDANANGYARGEGVCAVILKPLDQAIKENHKIYGILSGSMIMHHGRSASLTAPNVAAQELLLQKALRDAKKTVDDIDFIQAHGTGTKLGDPIEISAIEKIYRERGTNVLPLYIHSVKANIGHLEGAAGLSGLFAILASFQANAIPPNANLIKLNPNIASLFTAGQLLPNKESFVFPTKLTEFNHAKILKKPLAAAVSSFGYNGTIAHVIVEQYVSLLAKHHNPRPSIRFDDEYHPVICSYLPENKCTKRTNTTVIAPPPSSPPLIPSDALTMNLFSRYSPVTIIDHQIHHRMVLPGAAMIELFDHFSSFQSVENSHHTKDSAITDWRIYNDLIIFQPFTIEEFSSNDKLFVQIVKDSTENELKLYRIDSTIITHSRENLLASITYLDTLQSTDINSIEPLICVHNEETNWLPINMTAFYEIYKQRGLVFGNSYQLFTELLVTSNKDYFMGRIPITALLKQHSIGLRYPVQLIDACIHAAGSLLFSFHSDDDDHEDKGLFIPFSIESVSLKSVFNLSLCDENAVFQLNGRLIHQDANSAVVDLVLVDDRAEAIVVMKGLHMRQYTPPHLSAVPSSIQTGAVKEEEVEFPKEPQFLHLSTDHWQLNELLSLSAEKENTVSRIHAVSWPRVHSSTLTFFSSPLKSICEEFVVLAPSMQCTELFWKDNSADCLLLLVEEDSSQSIADQVRSFTQLLVSIVANYRQLKRLILVAPAALPRESSASEVKGGCSLSESLTGVLLSGRLEFFQIQFTIVYFEQSILQQLHGSEGLLASTELSFAKIWKTILASKEVEHLCSVVPGSNDDRSDLPLKSQIVQLFSKRWDQLQTISLAPPNMNWKYELCPGRGSIDSLTLVPSSAQICSEDDENVVVDINFVGLNFRDVLNVLDLYPGNPGLPGCEFSGIVHQCGSAVKHLRVGDRVIGFHSDCLQQQITLPAYRCHILPPEIPLTIGAMIPVVYSTIELALMQLAKIQSSDVILIHAAAGGIGLAAIQYAHSVGATVIGTTSNPTKKEYLQTIMKVPFICSSRNASDFRQELQTALFTLQRTSVTIVLNSLSDEFILYSIDALVKGGTFLELGKRGIWSKEKMSNYRPDVEYHCIELDTIANNLSDPSQYQTIVAATCMRIMNMPGWCEKPIHYQTMDFYSQTKDAFHLLRSGKTIGKLLLAVNDSSLKMMNRKEENEEGAYLITGGTGGLGLRTAEYLLTRYFASRVYLLSRRGIPTESTESTFANQLLAKYPDKIVMITGDVTKAEEIERLFHDLTKDEALFPLKGIFHCAGIVEDALLKNQEKIQESFDHIWQVKANAAWLLHHYSSSLTTVKHFVLFSSMISKIGREGQAIYAAANRSLDDLAEFRKRQGLPAVSLRLPAFHDVGMAVHANTKMEDWSISSDSLSSIFDHTLWRENNPSSIWNVYPSTFTRILDPSMTVQFPSCLDDQIYNKEEVAVKSAQTQDSPTGTVFLSSKSSWKEMILQICEEFYPKQVVLSIEEDTNLIDIGLDSLAATEFANRLGKLFHLKLPATFLFNYSTMEAILIRLESMIDQQQQQQQSPPKQTIMPSFLSEVSKSDEEVSTSDESALDEASDKNDRSKDIAIIGVSCAFPGEIYSLASFQEALHAKKVLTSELSSLRAKTAAPIFENNTILLNNKKELKSMICSGGFLADEYLQQFDYKTFEITYLESNRMDIRQKMILKLTYQALQDSGIEISSLKGKKVGVFAACSGHLKTSIATSIGGNGKPSVLDATSNAMSVLSGRVSFIFGFEGPCMTIDTACSSSLVALHTARRSLQAKDCDYAVVVGVNYLDIDFSIPFGLSGMLSMDGRCHTFDEKANGYCRGEGGGAIILQRWMDLKQQRKEEEGLSNGIYAIVKGSALMQDGRSASLTAPNGLVQEKLLQAALYDAQLTANEIDYIEAHGTGTKLGDPIEIEAIQKVFGPSMEQEKNGRDHPLYVSSVKGNIGHLEGAAGMAGLLAGIVALQTQSISPNANLIKLNQEIVKLLRTEDRASTVPEAEENLESDWIHFPSDVIQSDGKIRHVGISSFGYCGTIAHCILAKNEEEA